MSMLDRVLHRGRRPDASAGASAPPPQEQQGPEPAREQAPEQPLEPGKGSGATRADNGLRPATPAQAEQIAAEIPGGRAASPTDIPKAGWVQIAKRGWKEAGTDQVPLLAAGVAFYAFLSILPAITALVLLYGLAFDPSDVQSQINGLGPAVPDAAKTLLQDQLTGLASKSSGGLGIGLVVSVLVALWSASNGAGNLITAVNIAYDERETRGFIKRKALALVITLGAIVFVVVALALIAVLPEVLDAVGLSGAARLGVQVLRWALLLGAMTGALGVMYRTAPDRADPKVKWVSVGAVLATALWILVSIGFSLYAKYGGYGSSYGSLAGVVVLLMWLWLTAYAILLGAEVNAEAEQQTVKDTTTGPPQPIGERNAVKADSLPG
jgi:membrane protein